MGHDSILYLTKKKVKASLWIFRRSLFLSNSSEACQKYIYFYTHTHTFFVLVHSPNPSQCNFSPSGVVVLYDSLSHSSPNCAVTRSVLLLTVWNRVLYVYFWCLRQVRFFRVNGNLVPVFLSIHPSPLYRFPFLLTIAKGEKWIFAEWHSTCSDVGYDGFWTLPVWGYKKNENL